MSHGDRPASHSAGSRSAVLAMNGLAATSQPLASAAALRILQDGGNAVDAAIAAAAVLNVVEPMSTGIGGDMFALVYMQQDAKPVGLNGSGWAGSKASPEFFKSRRLTEIPMFGMHSVTVPGAVAGWYKLHGRYGKLPMNKVLAPAIHYAEAGYPVSEIIAGLWQRAAEKLLSNPEAVRTLLPDARAPRHGDVVRFPALARTFRRIAEGGRDAFYKGEIAEQLVAFSDRHDGMLAHSDFEEFDAQWVEPVSTDYRGLQVFELGAQTQGITVLEMLNILEAFDLRSLGHNSASYLHLLIEAKKLAFADRDAYIADPDKTDVPVRRLISKEYAAERRKLISTARAMASPRPGLREHGDTVYLTVVDQDRNAVSFINSLFEPFGSGLVAGETGIVLQNRGALFSLEARHPNVVAARKRPFHTLIPGMVLKNSKPFFSFGVMGGDNQPQGHVQVLLNLIDFAMDPQQAGEAPRFRHTGQDVFLESAFNDGVRSALETLGHPVKSGVDLWGGYQGILIDASTNALIGGSDPRKDGLAIGW